MMIVRIFILVLIILALACSGFSAEPDANQAQLKQVAERIEKAEKDLKNNKRVELDLARELALLKRNLQRIDERLSSLKDEQADIKVKVRKQKSAIADSQQALKKSRQLLEKRLVVLYKEGEVGPLKILFSAESPTQMVQQYQYLTRVLERDSELLENYRSALEDQRLKLDDLEVLEAEQRKTVAKEQEQYDIAAEARQLQNRLLGKATKDQAKLKSQLAALREKEKALKGLIKKIAEQEAENRSAPIQSAPDKGPVATDFAVGRGKLGWPVQGRVIIAFGTQRDHKLGTYYESNGIEIAAKRGQTVKAVAGGKVVFADYFKGYGNLVIVSHPGGYHTLYAHTDRMQKKTGDIVSAGDVLGYSGLAGRDSVYFEIRKKGSPVNPLSWLKRR